MTTAFEAIIIGAGQAGPPLARRLTAAGMSVAVIERGAFGGTCVNTGCIPTKPLIANAYAAHMARRAADFGVAVDGPVRVDMSQVKARKDAIFRTVATWRRTEPQNSRQMHGLPRPCALSRATRCCNPRCRSIRPSRNWSQPSSAICVRGSKQSILTAAKVADRASCQTFGFPNAQLCGCGRVPDRYARAALHTHRALPSTPDFPQ